MVAACPDDGGYVKINGRIGSRIDDGVAYTLEVQAIEADSVVGFHDIVVYGIFVDGKGVRMQEKRICLPDKDKHGSVRDKGIVVVPEDFSIIPFNDGFVDGVVEVDVLAHDGGAWHAVNDQGVGAADVVVVGEGIILV